MDWDSLVFDTHIYAVTFFISTFENENVKKIIVLLYFQKKNCLCLLKVEIFDSSFEHHCYFWKKWKSE